MRAKKGADDIGRGAGGVGGGWGVKRQPDPVQAQSELAYGLLFAQTRTVKFRPMGAVSEAYWASWPRLLIDGKREGVGIKLLSGPVGSGKTILQFLMVLDLATRMPVSPVDGYRRFRFVIYRVDYPDLWGKTIESWKKVFPQDIPGFAGVKNRPAEHKIKFMLPDGTILFFEVLFRALGNDTSYEAIEDDLGGFEFTVALINEVAAAPRALLETLIGRAGRYPDVAHGQPKWFGVLGDFNKSHVGHWLYDFINKLPENAVYFEQPGGLDDGAENLENLPRGYYQGVVEANKHRPDYIQRMVHNQWAERMDGKAVYQNWARKRHVAAQRLAWISDRPLVLGGDAGRHPAVVAAQEDDWGQVRVLGVIYRSGMPASRFGPELNRWLAQWFPDVPRALIRCWGDPASAHGTETSDESWMDIVGAATNTTWRPAPGHNAINLRLDTVGYALSASTERGEPRLLISPAGCVELIAGFDGDYHFQKVTVRGEEITASDPVKNDASHPMDALQNCLLGLGIHREMLALQDRAKRRDQFKPVTVKTEFSVW